jgi:hypothetical protein
MTVVPADIRLEYPEFTGLTDPQIQAVLDRAGRQLQIERWGVWLDDGIKAFTAHTLLVRYQVQLGIGDALKAIESDKSKSTPSTNPDDYFKSTAYGIEFLQLQNQLPVMGSFVV